jgi:hypothetical protein
MYVAAHEIILKVNSNQTGDLQEEMRQPERGLGRNHLEQLDL